MKFLLVVAALAHIAHSGHVGVRTSNLLAPAGVTYVDGSYHAGLAAGPLAYSASVAQPVYQSVAAAPALAVASQPVAVSPAPVAYAATATKYAAVPTVQHVQGVADVPVTRIDAQPAVIQKTVDVARPAVKTQRYEVRRPAIQKQFYDIEERVVVRPAGSAVVELDEPLSRTQKGPSVIRPTGEAVAVSSSAVAVPAAPAVATLPAVSAVSPAPAELPSVEINLARSSIPAAAPAAVSSVGYARSSFAAAAPAPAPSVEFRTALPSATPAPLPSVSFARTASAPAPVPSAGFARTTFAAAPAPAPLPSVEVRSSFAAPAPVQSVSYSAPLIASPVGISSVPVKTVSVSAPIHTISGVSSISSGASGISSVSAGPTEVSFSTPAPEYQQQIVQSTPAPQLSDDSVSIDSADFSLARSAEPVRTYPRPQVYASPAPAPAPAPAPVSAPTQEAVFRSAVPARRFPAQPAPAARGSLIVNYPNALDLIPQSRFRSASVYSEGNFQSEVNHENQQRLLQLLTARGSYNDSRNELEKPKTDKIVVPGGVSEVGFGRSGPASYPVEAGQVRARVLSATPAPAYAAPSGERVNTRRVVVSRPIETLQEVEVAEPVTKYERVRVDQPTVVKTASQDVIRVPTSVPVYGKTLAPIAEAPVAAYSAGWH